MTLIVHSAMSRIGWVISGAEALIWALMDVVGPRGTLVMPTFTGHLSDPASWIDPPAPAEWHERIRAATLPFHPALTRTRNMGQVPELFRIWPGAHRSNHPLMSLAAWGRDAASLVAQHPLPWALGDASPMGRCYERDSRVVADRGWLRTQLVVPPGGNPRAASTDPAAPHAGRPRGRGGLGGASGRGRRWRHAVPAHRRRFRADRGRPSSAASAKQKPG